MKPSIEDRINRAFNEHRETLILLNNLARERKHPKEIVILVCSRLDALANSAMTNKELQRERFTSFLFKYYEKPNELQQVALPNMYFDIITRSEILELTFPTAGRIRSYDMTGDRVFLEFINASGLPLTSDDVRKLLLRLSYWLRQAYRTSSTQPKSKPHIDIVDSVVRNLETKSKAYRKGLYNQAVTKIKPFVCQFRLAEILYRDYRCRSIHESSFATDERFFTEPGLYLETRYHTFFETRSLNLCVSARWLIELYRSIAYRYQQKLIHLGKIPIDLWIELCGVSELSFLDESTIPNGKDYK